jgi:hypothetical protein
LAVDHTRENVCQLATRYGVSYRQAYNYIADAKKLMTLDFAGERAEFLNQVNNMRMHTVKKALKRGNFQVVAQLLDSLGRAMGEGSVEEAANAAPNLNITIEDKRIAAGSFRAWPVPLISPMCLGLKVSWRSSPSALMKWTETNWLPAESINRRMVLWLAMVS